MNERWKWLKSFGCSAASTSTTQVVACGTLLLMLSSGSGCRLEGKSGIDTSTDSQNLLSQAGPDNANTIILLKRIDKDGSAYTAYEHRADYADTNNNGIIDPGDKGFFNPGSTVKVAIAMAALDRMEELGLSLQAEYKTSNMPAWIRLAKDIERMVVISDNEATNRIILWLGFDALQNALARRGIELMDINRLMLDRGTLIPSPSYVIRDRDRSINDGPHQVSKKPKCLEIGDKVGNCTTASSLVASMLIVVTGATKSSQPTESTVSKGSNKYYVWLQETLAKRPHELGYRYEANYCRFIDGAKPAQRNRQIRRLLSKCGVAPFTRTYSDLSYLEMNDGQRYVLLIAKKYSFRPSDQAVVSDFQKLAVRVLSEIPSSQ